jgi:membrane protease YdiL (CAAX protease family)
MSNLLLLGASVALLYNVYLLFRCKERLKNLEKKTCIAVSIGFIFFIIIREGLVFFINGTGSINDFDSPEIAFLYLIILACIIAPAVEEIIFREFLLRVFKRAGFVLSAVLSSIGWAAIHYDNGFWVFYIFAIGLYFCAVRVKTDSLLIVIALHGIANTLTVLLALTGL